jgi:hypothetical protein
MKFLNLISILLLTCLFAFFSCQKEEDVVAISEFMNAQVDGKSFKATSFVVARAGVTTSINGTIGPASTPESIGLSIQNAKLGTFVFGENTQDFAWYKSTMGEYRAMSGTLQITALSREWIEGNFSFTAHSVNDPAKHATISNGEFKLKLD